VNRRANLLSRTNADLLASAVRDITRQLEEPGGLDRLARGLEFFDAWAHQYRASRIYGYTPWEAASIEWCVLASGTYRFSPSPLHEPYPGVPRQWLHSGGPNGDDERLLVDAGRSLDGRIRDLVTKIGMFKQRGVLFYVKQLPKTQFGFTGIQTAAYSAQTLNVQKQQPAGEKVIRLSRAKC
jgi:hypothetical protein